MNNHGRVVVVTGGSGFIGSNFVDYWLENFPADFVVNLDCHTYAADFKNIQKANLNSNYRHRMVDIRDASLMESEFASLKPHLVFHFAAETHVDRSIHGPREFVNTNMVGTFNLLEACRKSGAQNQRIILISTDEVYGSAPAGAIYNEQNIYKPSSVYSASKAGADHLGNAYARTYGMNVIVTHCSNNYGPRQAAEKFIPTVIRCAALGMDIPIYGSGQQQRDWIHVEDHIAALVELSSVEYCASPYCIGTGIARKNLDMALLICDAIDSLIDENRWLDHLRLPSGDRHRSLIKHVEDRPGHDYRYCLDSGKLRYLTGWARKKDLERGIRDTVLWYLEEHFTRGA